MSVVKVTSVCCQGDPVGDRGAGTAVRPDVDGGQRQRGGAGSETRTSPLSAPTARPPALPHSGTDLPR